MRSFFGFLFKDLAVSLSSLFLIVMGAFVLNSLDKPLFPSYFIYIFLAIGSFWFFSQVSFEIVSIFSKYFYIVSVLLLLLPLVIGQITRGTVRWIALGPLSFQPAELVRPFLILFFANYLAGNKISLPKTLKSVGLLVLPLILIVIQPSLGVAILTAVGFLGVILASRIDKKYILFGILGVIALLPIFWKFLAGYQRERILTFFNPEADPLGAGYNSLQSVVAVGSGRIFGTGLGKGIQTQLAFLPEKQTDFIFAAVAEELGLVGAGLVLIASFIILFRFTKIMENAVSPPARAYLAGFFLTFLVQIFIHVGMNLGMLPVTGIPYPLLSAGGSSLLATMIGIGIALGATKR